MDKLNTLFSRWEVLRAALIDLINSDTNSSFISKLNDQFIMLDNFMKVIKRNEDPRKTLNDFSKKRWIVFCCVISNFTLPETLIELMNYFIEYDKKLIIPINMPTLSDDYNYFTSLLKQTLTTNDITVQIGSSNNKEPISVSETTFDIFPAIFFSLGVVKRRLLDSQNEEFKKNLNEFVKLLKEVDKVNYCKRLISVMDGEIKALII